jgi:hypothetical protein
VLESVSDHVASSATAEKRPCNRQKVATVRFEPDGLDIWMLLTAAAVADAVRE